MVIGKCGRPDESPRHLNAHATSGAPVPGVARRFGAAAWGRTTLRRRACEHPGRQHPPQESAGAGIHQGMPVFQVPKLFQRAQILRPLHGHRFSHPRCWSRLAVMKRTLRRNSARRKRSSLALSEGAATGQTPPQPFERRMLQQNERVPHIVRVGLGTHRQHRADGLHQPRCPTAGIALPRISFLNAHAVSTSRGVCHTHCNGARPFRAAADGTVGSAQLSAINCQLSTRLRRDDALKAWVNGHVQVR